jgi:phosphotransferase system  glucose/maltose/N-acetylglucosamine-specific IIC component
LTIRKPLVVLGIILLIGLGVRGWRMTFPLQQDEYGPLYAVAQREGLPPGQMATEEYPLKPVGSWQEVRERSILPYGIVNPVPLYHWLLYAVVQVCPITEWALRLPSLLAGLGCIAAVYFLCRRLLGAEVALVAALLAAVDPMQVEVSVMARPYAIGNLACVLSFWGLLGILCGRSTAARGAAAVLYGVCMALIGYLNPVLLLVGLAHVGMVAYWWLGRPREEAALASAPADARPPLNADEWAFHKVPPRSASQLLFWLLGCALGLVLQLPQLNYVREVGQFGEAHRDYLFALKPWILTSFVLHNSSFLVGLLAVSLATLAMRQLSGGGQEAAEKESAGGATEGAAPPAEAAAAEPVALPPQPENPDVLWLGRCWLFLPQVLCVVLGYFLQISSSRYFTYVNLGGAILLAYWATRERARDVRLGVVGMVALATFLWGFTDWSLGYGLYTGGNGAYIVEALNKTQAWRPGDDVVLYRSNFLESDFLPDGFPEANRAHVEGVLAAPITTLYASKVARPYILLSMSQRRNDREQTRLGKYYDPSVYYNEDLVRKIGQYQRYWVCTSEWNRRAFLAAIVPWLANTQQWDMLVARRRDEPERYFLVPSGTQPDDYVAGLTDSRFEDFTSAVLVRRAVPSGGFSLGAVGATMMPNSHLTVPVWLASQCPTPHPTKPPAIDLSKEDSEQK